MGDFNAPANNRNCSEAVNRKHGILGEARWSFSTCPDLLECKLNRHDCVEHAKCNDTIDGYECQCERGYVSSLYKNNNNDNKSNNNKKNSNHNNKKKKTCVVPNIKAVKNAGRGLSKGIRYVSPFRCGLKMLLAI